MAVSVLTNNAEGQVGGQSQHQPGPQSSNVPLTDTSDKEDVILASNDFEVREFYSNRLELDSEGQLIYLLDNCAHILAPDYKSMTISAESSSKFSSIE